MPHRTVLALTLGDPNGLGPELVCRIFQEGLPSSLADACVLIIGPEQALMHHQSALNCPPFWQPLEDLDQLNQLDQLPRRTHRKTPPGIYLYAPNGLESFQIHPGHATVDGGLAAGKALETACLLLQSSRVQALTTGPLNKAMLQLAGFDFAGHTEFLAAKAGLSPEDVCMHFWGPRLRVSLATTHPPLRSVPELLNIELILRKLELTLAVVHAEGRQEPVAVCGLNPHAGEAGHIGDEDRLIIAPAVSQAVARGWNVVGPLAADTIFHRAVQGDFSAVLAMYHDQGLTAFKVLHFHDGVQITLGLPYVRTSPDHGTGYDLVGHGRASTQSLCNALIMAVALTGR
ncbi:4-hydroxythreonine-4-phosphate dehydrogenase PdxA [Desulfonatronum thioautotrophicum]|uniref:4-hydroxythreonine-4-phosphate dehydrogenase PdxA n=1 Tax=Desulfonatronum thioautotrophicum TaxID=617001 RepID=UPI0005EACA38|nr:4-hydroxythreonine-4-phosphate dehydrogenase PdxA [Desulfonatronum thioautotrophicum]